MVGGWWVPHFSLLLREVGLAVIPGAKYQGAGVVEERYRFWWISHFSQKKREMGHPEMGTLRNGIWETFPILALPDMFDQQHFISYFVVNQLVHDSSR
jgi:hypothetical protein